LEGFTLGISELKIIATGVIFVVTVGAAYLPYKLVYRNRQNYKFSIGNALASGIFLGTALLHMLASASDTIQPLHIEYPVVYFFAGSTFLVLLLLEHVGMELNHRRHQSQLAISILAVAMLSIHSLFEGIALGSSTSVTTALVVATAILAHKWAASFALAVELNRSDLATPHLMAYFFVFALATPIGVSLGGAANLFFPQHALTVAILNSMAAGTFLYIGTLHGLQSSVMVEKCCDLRAFAWVIIGFLLMAVVPFIG
jgi:solute carrier family 39 (zinc transporter), member 1/2/3